MLVALLLAGLVAASDQPRITMLSEPGDALRAEIFDLEADDVPGQVARLLGVSTGDDAVEQAQVVVRTTDRLTMAYRDGTLPHGPVVLYAEAQPHVIPISACRLTRDPQGVVDNSEQAAVWCLSIGALLAPAITPAPVT